MWKKKLLDWTCDETEKTNSSILSYMSICKHIISCVQRYNELPIEPQLVCVPRLP